MSSNFAISVTFAGYLLLVLTIGVLAWRRTLDQADYLLGGRRLNRWVAALSAQASDMSGWLLLGLLGYAYASGLESLWLAFGLLAGVYCNWRLVARRLRLLSEALGNALTLPEYLARRFGAENRLLKLIAALFILIFFVFYTSSGLVAGGKLFSTVFDWPYQWAVVVGALTVVVYTFLGGFLAVSWTDAFQGTLMLVALLVVPLIAMETAGGWPRALTGIQDLNPDLLSPLTDNGGNALTVVGIASLLAWGLGYFGQPHILARFMAIRSAGEIPAAGRVAVGWSLLAMAGAILVGLAGLVLLEEPLAGAATETVFIRLVELLFHPLLAGIWLAAILAAIMSTADSQLLVASSAISEDLYRGLLRPAASDRELLWLARGAVLVIALVAGFLAMDPERQVLDLVSYAWAGFGASFGPAILISLYWRGMSDWGAVAGILAGGLTVILWKPLAGGLFELYEIVPGVIAATLAIIIVSRLTPPPAMTLSLLEQKP